MTSTHLASQLLANAAWARAARPPLEVECLRPPADERKYIRRIEALGITTTVRATRGREIDRACVQIATT